MNYKRWIFPDVDKQEVSLVSEECDLDPIVTFIAFARGLSDPYEIEQFISEEPDFCDPYEYSGMADAVDRINVALESEEKILVFGDYDCDGVTSTALLTGYLRSRNANVDYYVPDREKDGYGISVSAVEKAAADGYTLIVTVDNGISAIAEAERAAALSVDMVITDHHIPSDTLPNAAAVIDPHLDEGGPFSDLCGVGVAFKLICALDGRPCEEMIYEYADLVTLGTIADVVPLHGENRMMVSIGLKVMNRTPRVGVRALMEAASCRFATSGGVAFSLCPRINAAGRMALADTAVKLLLSTDSGEAGYFAECLDRFNTDRQAKEQQIFESAVSAIESNGLSSDRVIVVDGAGWHPGVLGIVAAKIVQKYARPSIVINDGGEVSVGSCRSIPGFSIYEALSSCSHLLKKFGGHELAAGLTVREEDIDALRREINAYAAAKPLNFPTVRIDCRVKPTVLNVDVAKSLKILEPYGEANPTPLFAVTDCKIAAVLPLSGGKHIKLKLSKDGREFWALKFGMSPDNFPFSVGDVIDVAVNLDVNVYNNTESASILIREIRPGGIDCEETERQLSALDLIGRGEVSATDAGSVCPSRADVAGVFRTVKKYGTVSYDRLENMLCRYLPVGKINIAVKALCQLGIVSLDEAAVSLTDFDGKADLDSAEILITLKNAMGGGYNGSV